MISEDINIKIFSNTSVKFAIVFYKIFCHFLSKSIIRANDFFQILQL